VKDGPLAGEGEGAVRDHKVLANFILVLAITSLTLNCLNVVIIRQSWPYLAAL
jgi:hypothetical protein